MRQESAIQGQIRRYIEAAGFHSVHVPNGAVLRGDKIDRAKQMNALKRDGLVPGFPDLLVYGKGQRIGHIEVKTPKGEIGENQAKVGAWLQSLGHHYAVCRSLDDAVAALKSWGWISTSNVDNYLQFTPWAEGSAPVEQNKAEECCTTPRPTPETLDRSAADAT